LVDIIVYQEEESNGLYQLVSFYQYVKSISLKFPHIIEKPAIAQSQILPSGNLPRVKMSDSTKKLFQHAELSSVLVHLPSDTQMLQWMPETWATRARTVPCL
jgi:hypothetical protein